MDVLTEASLRSACPLGECEYTYAPGTFVTKTAREYAVQHHIRLVEQGWTAMGYTKPADEGAAAVKPEAMTHIRAGELVAKTDPRIGFRGKMDSFQGEVLCTMAFAHRSKKAWLVDDLTDVLQLCRNILAAEVKQTPLAEWTLFGMDAESIHKASHQPPHPVPDYRMGETAMALNRLRALSRELELCWLAAYPSEARPDIVLALNRLSSGLYLLFRKEVKDHG